MGLGRFITRTATCIKVNGRTTKRTGKGFTYLPTGCNTTGLGSMIPKTGMEWRRGKTGAFTKEVTKRGKKKGTESIRGTMGVFIKEIG